MYLLHTLCVDERCHLGSNFASAQVSSVQYAISGVKCEIISFFIAN